jgi:hypothetical protein
LAEEEEEDFISYVCRTCCGPFLEDKYVEFVRLGKRWQDAIDAGRCNVPEDNTNHVAEVTAARIAAYKDFGQRTWAS